MMAEKKNAKNNIRFYFKKLLVLGEPEASLPNLGAEVKQLRTETLMDNYFVRTLNYLKIEKLKLINNHQINDNNILREKKNSSDVRRVLDFPSVNKKRGTNKISKIKSIPQKNDDSGKKENKNKKGKEFSAVVHKIENFEELKDEAMLYEKIKHAAPKAINGFTTNTKKLIVVFENKEDRDNFNKKVVKDEIFGKDVLVSKADKKPFVFYARNVLKSYNEDFIKKRILEKYKTNTEVKVLDGPENRKTRTVRISATKIDHLKKVLEKEMIEIGFTKHRVTLPTAKAIQMCFSCGKNGHMKEECDSEVQFCTFCTGSHKREDCKSENPKCIKCSGNHPTTSRNCPKRKVKINWLEKKQKKRIEKEWKVKVGESPLRNGVCAIFKNAVQSSLEKAVKEIDEQIFHWKNNEINKIIPKPKKKRKKIWSWTKDKGKKIKSQ